MKLLTRADNLMIATLWQQMLETAGIRCEVRNRYIGAAVGELPADQVAPQIWLRDDDDEERATALLAELRQPGRLASWSCFKCGEIVEGQFFQCWNCEAPRGSRED
jgi:rubrerythrin